MYVSIFLPQVNIARKTISMISKVSVLVSSLCFLCHCMDSIGTLNCIRKKIVKTALYTIKVHGLNTKYLKWQ